MAERARPGRPVLSRARPAWRRPLPVAGALLLLAVAGWLLFGRQTARPAAPAEVAPVREVAAAATAGRPVVFVGMDGADWQLLDDYMERGLMPNLRSLVAEGRRGVLLTEEPALSPLLWTTMLTGSSPLDHRILDFAHYHPLSGELELISSSERRRPAIWNMATYGGKSVAVFGQWATYPAEEVNGVLVSDRLFTFLYQEDTPPPRVVHPPTLEPWARRTLAEVEAEVGLEAMRAYLPWLDAATVEALERGERSYDDPVSALRRILVETRLYHRLATEHIGRHRPDLTVLYIQGTDSVGHIFAPFAPPRQETVSEREFERFHRVPELFFQEIDGLLGGYRRLAAEMDAVLVLASDHGFLWREGRPAAVSSHDTETAAQWHRREGIYLIWGLGPPPAGAPATGGIRQLCASLLALLGLPDGTAVQGPALAGIGGSTAPPVEYGRYYRPALPAPPAGSAEISDEELDKLRALGYLGGETAAARPAGDDSTLTAAAHANEALVLMGLKRYADAEAALDRALALDPERPATLLNRGILLAESGRLDEAIDSLRVAVEATPAAAQPRFNLAAALQRAGRWREAIAEYDRVLELAPGYPRAEFFRAVTEGQSLVSAGRFGEAAIAYHRAVELSPMAAEPRIAEATAMVRAGDWAAARTRLEEGLGQMPQNANLAHVLARLLVTAPDPDQRDGARALELAEGVFRARDTLEHGETVAMALAELGRFEEAASFQQRLIDSVRRAGQQELLPGLEANLARYRGGRTIASG